MTRTFRVSARPSKHRVLRVGMALLLSLTMGADGALWAVPPQEEEDSGRSTAVLPPGSPDGEGSQLAREHEGPRQGMATTLPDDPDGETPYDDPPGPGGPPAGPVSPDLSPAQVLQLTELARTSKRPFSSRLDNTFAVPATLRGSWERPEQGPALAAAAFVSGLHDLFQIAPVKDGLRVVSVGERLFTNVKLQQTYQGIDVFGAELLVHTKPVPGGGTELRFLHGTFVPHIDVPVDPQVSAAQARNVAATHVEQATESHVVGGGPARLMIFNTGVFDRRAPTAASHLAWRFDLPTDTPGENWVAFVDARSGVVVTAWDNTRDIHPSQAFEGNSTSATVDDDLWYEDGVKLIAGTPSTDVTWLESFGDNYYDWLLAHYAIDSLDDAGLQMVGRANFGAVVNAFWSPSAQETSFGPAMATQDIVGHEFTHGLVQLLGGDLTYLDESGALNEAHADIVGEYLDCQNGTGCNWEVGNDSQGNTNPLGRLRSLSDPPLEGQPDHYQDFVVTAGDAGGVHTNSGILNKFGYLIAEGGEHHGVTVNGIGVNKAGQVILDTLVNTGLTSSATYFEYGDVVLETCDAIVGNAVVGEPTAMSEGDCRDVQRACYAVGICPLTQADGWGLVEAYDRFGYTLASADFNNDGYDDLAVGSPYEDRDGVADAGTLNVFYGSPSGIGSANAEIIHQGSAGTTNEAYDRFGWSLATGDINGDGYADLAVGAPYEDLGATADAGWIFTFFGGPDGLLDSSGNASYERLSQASAGTISESNDLFGWSLAAGDIDNDGYDDVVLGAPYEDLGATVDTGRITVLYGAAGGLRVNGTGTFEHLWQDAAGTTNVAFDRFGHAVSVGDITGDGLDDVVAGTPWKDFSGGITDAGWIMVFLASSQGLLDAAGLADFERLSQDSVGTARENSDLFGYSLLLTDIDGDGHADCIAGTPYEDLGALTDAGWLIPIYGTANGLRSGGVASFERISQSSLGTVRELGDKFGFSLAAGDRNRDGFMDVLVGSPDEELSGEAQAGWVFQLGGSASGLLPANNLARWSETSMGGVREAYERLGWSVASGDFDGDGDHDAAAGAPYEDVPPIDAGAVFFHE